MAGTKAGGLRAAITNKLKYGPDFYKNIGAQGGTNGSGPTYEGGYASHGLCDGSCGFNAQVGTPHKKSQCGGYKGGVKSRRAKRDESGL